MKLILKSNNDILDKQFLTHLFNFFPKIFFGGSTKRKLKKFDSYLNDVVFKQKRRYSIYQIVMIILRNITFETDNKQAIIRIDPNAIFPYTTYKIKDIASLIDEGNLDIKGSHVFQDFFKYIEENIDNLRLSYEKGLF